MSERRRRIEDQRRAMGWSGSYELERRAATCPDCDEPLATTVVHQDALIRHGGYGGTITTSRAACISCGAVGSIVHATTRPPR